MLPLRKINEEGLLKALTTIFESGAERNKARKADRRFVETVEIQIGLKGFDPARDKRLNVSTVLPVAPKELKKYRICLFGNEKQCEEAESLGVPCKNMAELKGFKRNKKLVKAMAKQFDSFIASSTLIKRIPRLLGPTLNKIGKFPTPITPNESVENKVSELQRTLKGSLKFKVGMPMCLAFPIGNLGQEQETVQKNLIFLVNYLVTQFKKGWQNVKRIHVKSTMGQSFKIYGF